MKKNLFTFLAILFTGTLFAQQDAATSAGVAAAETVKPGAVLSELAAGVDPKLFLKSFDRDAWKKNLDNIANPMAFGRSLTDLVLGMSPEAFGEEWAGKRTAWLSKAKGITNYADAAVLLKEFDRAHQWPILIHVL